MNFEAQRAIVSFVGMILILSIQSATAGSVGCGQQASAYQPNLTGGKVRIINGLAAKPHSWPWTVSFQYVGQQKCGASLLRVKENVEQSDIVLTAAHCVQKIKENGPVNVATLKPYTVLVGDHLHSSLEKGEERIGVVDFQMHANYSKMDKVNDLAILKLAKPVSFSDTVRPVCLPVKGEPIAVGQTCAAVGWGRIDSADERTTSDVLQQLIVPVHDQNKCFQKWVRIYNKELMTCAGATDASSSMCNGDSGGPLVCQSKDGRWVQQGIANFVGGFGGCDAKQPPVYARVSMFVDWINERISEMSSIK